jgi:lipoate-protein ligase A
MRADSTAWRLILDGDHTGARNMARDVAILEAVSEGTSPSTLRLYGWNPPCLTLGRHQHTDAADLDFCRAEGIDVVRRPTGGRALLHHLELTYAVIAPLGVVPLPRALQEAYSRICGALVRAMRILGIDAVLTGGEVNLQLPGPRTAIPCFEAPAGGEVVVAGRKLIGSAMRAHSGTILQHGAILLDWDSRLQAGSMGLADDSSLRPHVTTLTHELDLLPNRSELDRTLVQAFADELEIAFEEGPLMAQEAAGETALAASFAVKD